MKKAAQPEIKTEQEVEPSQASDIKTVVVKLREKLIKERQKNQQQKERLQQMENRLAQLQAAILASEEIARQEASHAQQLQQQVEEILTARQTIKAEALRLQEIARAEHSQREAAIEQNRQGKIAETRAKAEQLQTDLATKMQASTTLIQQFTNQVQDATQQLKTQLDANTRDIALLKTHNHSYMMSGRDCHNQNYTDTPITGTNRQAIAWQ